MNRNDGNEGTGRGYWVDIVTWALWAILVWGFLGILALTESPKQEPGLDEVVILAYFLGFPVVFALIYFLAGKRGA